MDSSGGLPSEMGGYQGQGLLGGGTLWNGCNIQLAFPLLPLGARQMPACFAGLWGDKIS